MQWNIHTTRTKSNTVIQD